MARSFHNLITTTAVTQFLENLLWRMGGGGKTWVGGVGRSGCRVREGRSLKSSGEFLAEQKNQPVKGFFLTH